MQSESQMQSWGSPARRSWLADEEMSLLPREEEQPRGGNRRLARYRLMQTAVPCALVAGMLMAIVFTVGHTGTIARRAVNQHSIFSDTALFLSDSAFASEHPLAPAAFSTINLVQLKTPSHAREPHRQKSQQQQDVGALSPDSAVYRHDGIHERREAQRAREVD